MSALDKGFSIFLSSHCLYKLLLSFPYIQTTSKNTSPNSSWAEFICRGICRQVALRPQCALCWVGAGVKVEEGAGALLTFFIYVLRFQDTWKGFAPFLLIGYRPQGSLLIYVPNKSPRQAVSLLYWGLSPHLDASLGVVYDPEMLGKWVLPATDLGCTRMVLHTQTSSLSD